MGCICTARAFLWFAWFWNFFFSVVYSGVILYTFKQMRDATKHVEADTEQQKETYRNSIMASCILGFFIVVFWNVWSLLVMISRWFADAKIAYGIMLGCAIHTAWFQLLAGLVLQTSDPLAKQFRDSKLWSDSTYQTYQAAWVWCYMNIAEYIIIFFVFLWGRKYLGRPELDTPPPAPNPTAPPANRYVDMGSFKGTQV